MVLAGAEGFVGEAGSFTCFVFCNELKWSLVFMIVYGESDLLRAHQNKPPLFDTSVPLDTGSHADRSHVLLHPYVQD